MSKGNACQEAKAQEIEVTSPILIDSTVLGKKDFLRILHVDDDVCLLEVSKQILLMENNFEVENVTSVDEAFKKMEQQPFDGIVSDYEMPQKNGLEFLKQLREQNNQIPFILFTGKGREDVAVKALNLGADSYINKNGSPETVYCELSDAINKTVERKKSREMLAKSEAKYHALVENSLQGISILQAAPLRIVFANQAMGKILGYSTKELMALSPEGIMGLVHHENRAVFFKRMENRLRGELASDSYEFRGVRKDGSIIWMSAFANRVEYEGQPAVQGMFLDINESKKAEEVVKKSEARYGELANFLPEIVFETDLSGKITFLSQNAFEITGYRSDELEKGLNILQFVVPEDRERAKENIRRRMAGEKSDTSEYMLFRKNGETYPAIVKTAPIYSENRLNGLRGLVIDISERKKAEDALSGKEKRFRAIFDKSFQFALILDINGIVLEMNELCYTVHGPLAEGCLGKPFWEAAWWSQFPEVAEKTKLAIENCQVGKIVHDEVEFVDKDFQIHQGIRIFSPIADENGKLLYISVVGLDISERKKAEEALRRSEEKHRIISGITADVTFSCTKNDEEEFLVDWISGACEKIFGYSAKEIKEKGCWKFAVQPPDLPIFEEKITHLKLGQKSMCELMITNKNGSTRWLKVKSIVEEDSENPGGLRLFGACTDITERKQKEFEVQLERDKLETVTENIGAGLFLVDTDYKILWTNNLSKYHFGELVSKQCYLAFRNRDEVCLDCGVREVFEKDKEIDVRELCFKDSKGDPGWLELTARPVKDETGKVVAALELAVPITARKKAEFNLLKNKALLLEAEKAGKIGGWEFDISTLTQSWTDETFRILEIDLTHGEPIVPKGIEFINPPYRATANEAIQSAIEHGEPYDLEWEITTAKGNKRWVHAVAKANYENSKITSISGSFQDITERKNSEKQIESLARFPFENPNIVIRINSNCKILYSNPASQQLANFIETETGKSSPKSWKSHIKEALSNNKQIKFVESYGDRIFSFNFFPIVSEGYVNVYGTEITELKKTETHRKSLEVKVNNYSEHLKCMVDLRTAQLKDANERLVKAERLAAIGELAGMIGHDLRNPLAGIKNGVYILKKKGTTISEAQSKETLEIIDKAIDHSNKIINDLLDYSREMNLKLIKYAARPLVDEAIRSIQVPDRIQIVNHVDKEACIWVDPDKIIRVFVNLLQNAIDATPENGKLEITSCQQSNLVEIAFSDTGKGIPAEILPKLFTPLFTTKAQGMGFGLAICKRIVEVHGGTIKVESVKDKGTKFIINLPVKSYPEPENKTI